MTEHDHQAAVCKWLTAKGILYFSVPNGSMLGGKNKFGLLAKMRREGFRNGAPDLVLIELAKDDRPVAVEMKIPNGRLNPEQRGFHDDLRGSGWHVVVGYGFEDAIEKLSELGF